MSAPQKATGGRSKRAASKSKLTKVPAERPPRGRSAGKPRRYRHGVAARDRILEKAVEQAKRYGYQRLRLRQITEAAEISHQGFYLHFRNKRHCLAAASSEQLAAVEQLLAGATDDAIARRLLEDVDRALTAAYPEPSGPQQRLVKMLVTTIQTKGYDAVRIAALTKAAAVGNEEFYRRYGGRRGCLQRVYAVALADCEEELREMTPAGSRAALDAIGEVLERDELRARLLLVAMPHIPPGPGTDEGFAGQQALPDWISRVLLEFAGEELLESSIPSLTGAVVEVCRSAIVSDGLDTLRESLVAVGDVLVTLPPAFPDRSRLAA